MKITKSCLPHHQTYPSIYSFVFFGTKLGPRGPCRKVSSLVIVCEIGFISVKLIVNFSLACLPTSFQSLPRLMTWFSFR